MQPAAAGGGGRSRGWVSKRAVGRRRSCPARSTARAAASAAPGQREKTPSGGSGRLQRCQQRPRACRGGVRRLGEEQSKRPAASCCPLKPLLAGCRGATRHLLTHFETGCRAAGNVSGPCLAEVGYTLQICAVVSRTPLLLRPRASLTHGRVGKEVVEQPVGPGALLDLPQSHLVGGETVLAGGAGDWVARMRGGRDVEGGNTNNWLAAWADVMPATVGAGGTSLAPRAAWTLVAWPAEKCEDRQEAPVRRQLPRGSMRGTWAPALHCAARWDCRRRSSAPTKTIVWGVRRTSCGRVQAC